MFRSDITDITDITDIPITRERCAELIACSIGLIDRHIARGVLRPVAHSDEGAPLFSSQDCWDLYATTSRGHAMVYGPHPRA